ALKAGKTHPKIKQGDFRTDADALRSNDADREITYVRPAPKGLGVCDPECILDYDEWRVLCRDSEAVVQSSLALYTQ
ncbi:hypothetical protein KIPB_016161, partial [Kipferlia bialata]